MLAEGWEVFQIQIIARHSEITGNALVLIFRTLENGTMFLVLISLWNKTQLCVHAMKASIVMDTTKDSASKLEWM